MISIDRADSRRSDGDNARNIGNFFGSDANSPVCNGDGVYNQARNQKFLKERALLNIFFKGC